MSSKNAQGSPIFIWRASEPVSPRIEAINNETLPDFSERRYGGIHKVQACSSGGIIIVSRLYIHYYLLRKILEGSSRISASASWCNKNILLYSASSMRTSIILILRVRPVERGHMLRQVGSSRPVSCLHYLLKRVGSWINIKPLTHQASRPQKILRRVTFVRSERSARPSTINNRRRLLQPDTRSLVD